MLLGINYYSSITKLFLEYYKEFGVSFLLVMYVLLNHYRVIISMEFS